MKFFARPRMTFYLDFDGPIVDNFHRHTNLYLELSKKYKFTPLDPIEYWDYKKKRISEHEILKMSSDFNEALFSDYQKTRISLIESRTYLSMNILVQDANKNLNFLKQHGDLVLVTTRYNRENLFWELEDKQIISHFDQILCDGQAHESSAETKIRLIKSYTQSNNKDDIIIGDTEAEILCAKNLNITSVAVTSGIRTEEYLLFLKPNKLVADLNEFVQVYKMGM